MDHADHLDVNSPDPALAVADLVGGELGRAENRCRSMLDETRQASASDRGIAYGALAVIAYLCGDFTAAQQLATCALDATGSGDRPAATSDASVRALAVPPMVLARHAIGADAHTPLHEHPLPRPHRAAIESLIGQGDPADEPEAFTTSSRPADPRSDLAIGAAAAALLGSAHGTRGVTNEPGRRAERSDRNDWGRRPVGALLDTLRAASAAGHRVSLAVPVSVERAQAVALIATGDLEPASELLDAAERRWRQQHAYTELAEVLVLHAEVAVALGRLPIAAELAAEGYSLAERLGLRAAKARALSLYHPEPGIRDLGRPDERLVLVSDVVGSTRVSTTEGDEAYFDLIMTHHGTVRPLLERHGGKEFSEGGDSLLAWFESPEEALDCAMEILAAVGSGRRSGCDLQVRVSLAGGRPFFREGRPYGSAVHLANRLLPRGAPGQIVVDEATLTLLGPLVPDFDRRTVELDGFGVQAVGFLPAEPAT